MARHTEPDEATKSADEVGEHSADRPATEEEAAAAEERSTRARSNIALMWPGTKRR